MIAAAGIFAACCAAFHGVVIDDAFIYFRYALHVHRGDGLVWNPGQPPVEGVSSLLWTFLLAPFASSREAVVPAARVLGVGAAVGAVGLAAWAARRLGGAAAGRTAALLLLASPALALHAMTGMETALAVAASAALSGCGVALATGPAHSRRRWAMAFGVVWWLGALCRPEFVLFGALVAGAVAVGWDRATRRATLPWLLAAALVPGAATAGLRVAYFGHLLPLPFYAKQGGGSLVGLGYVLLATVVLLGAPLALPARALVAARGRDPLLLLVLPPMLCFATFVLFRPIMGYVLRFAMPFWVPLVVATAVVLPRLARRRARVAIAVLLVSHAALAIPAWHVACVLSPATRATHVALGRALGELPAPGTLLALYDIGAAAFYSEWEAYEGAGLVTPEVAIDRRRAAWLIEHHRPDVVFLAECRSERLGDSARGAYVESARLPWIVFTDGSAAVSQCVWIRADWEQRAALTARLQGAGARPMAAPWYYGTYRTLRRLAGV